MNEARRVYKGHFIIRDSLIASVSGDEVQSEPARAYLLTCCPGAPWDSKCLFLITV